MKKIYALILTAILILAIPTVAFATSGKLDIDLSKLSYDELVELKDQINLAIWNSEEWEEVEVPEGIWEVGTDIPEGKWTLKAHSGANVIVKLGDELEDHGSDVKQYAFNQIMAEDHTYYEEGRSTVEWTVNLEKGTYVKISFGSVIFTPYAGKPDFGFKK